MIDLVNVHRGKLAHPKSAPVESRSERHELPRPLLDGPTHGSVDLERSDCEQLGALA